MFNLSLAKNVVLSIAQDAAVASKSAGKFTGVAAAYGSVVAVEKSAMLSAMMAKKLDKMSDKLASKAVKKSVRVVKKYGK